MYVYCICMWYLSLLSTANASMPRLCFIHVTVYKHKQVAIFFIYVLPGWAVTCDDLLPHKSMVSCLGLAPIANMPSLQSYIIDTYTYAWTILARPPCFEGPKAVHTPRNTVEAKKIGSSGAANSLRATE